MTGVVALVFMAFVSAGQNIGCKPGVVLDAAHGRDYTLTICGVGVVGLRGVEPPLRTADGIPLERGPASGELLGGPNVNPEAMAFLSKLIGQRVTVLNDGYRMGDRSERQYAYVFLPDKKTLLNAQMIRPGLGYADRQGSHPRRDEFIAIEEGARRLKLGVWAG